MWTWSKIFSLLRYEPQPQTRPRPILILRWLKIKDFAICLIVLMKRRRLVIGHGLTSSNNIIIIISSIDYIVQEEHHQHRHTHLDINTIIKENFVVFFLIEYFEIIWYCFKLKYIRFFFSISFGFVENWCIGDIQQKF